MNNKRVHVLFVMGEVPEHTLKQVVAAISKRYGGCAITKGQGTWSETSHENHQTYQQIKHENNIQIRVSTTPKEFDLAYLKSCFNYAKPFTNWIHCEHWLTQAEHFNIN